MRISFVLDSLWLSGGVRVIVEHANRLHAKGHRIYLIAPGGTLDPDVLEEIHPSITVKASPAGRTGSLNLLQKIALSWSLARTIPESEVIVSTHTPTTVPVGLAARLWGRGRPVWFYQDYVEMFLGRPVETWLARNAARWHERVFIVSEYSRQELAGIAPEDVLYVGNGLSFPELYQPAPAENERDEGRPQTILFLGDERPRKGLYDFLEAARLLREKLPKVRLVIVSKERFDLQTPLPAEYVYRPKIEELARLYATCDLFVSASWWESFGYPPLEAMACGAPVVTTDSRGVREYAVHDENCLITPPRDPRALADAMHRVLTDPSLADRLRQNGPPTAARFTWKKANDRFEQGLLSL